MKALHVVRSSGVPKKNFARWRMPNRRLALELGDVERETGLRVLKVRKINPRD